MVEQGHTHTYKLSTVTSNPHCASKLRVNKMQYTGKNSDDGMRTKGQYEGKGRG